MLEPLFAEIARETAEWVLAEMQSSEGGYFASLDADSEGHEGKFYIWNKSEVEKLLTPEEYKIVSRYFRLDQPANFENQWHLYAVSPLDNDAEQKLLVTAKQKLLKTREKRVHPSRDEKILTAWNALMIKGMLIAGNFLQEKKFIILHRTRSNLFEQNYGKISAYL